MDFVIWPQTAIPWYINCTLKQVQGSPQTGNYRPKKDLYYSHTSRLPCYYTLIISIVTQTIAWDLSEFDKDTIQRLSSVDIFDILSER